MKLPDIMRPDSRKGTFNITDYGAVATPKPTTPRQLPTRFDASPKLAAARCAITEHVFPGPFELASNSNLHLDDGADADVQRQQRTIAGWANSSRCPRAIARCIAVQNANDPMSPAWEKSTGQGRNGRKMVVVWRRVSRLGPCGDEGRRLVAADPS